MLAAAGTWWQGSWHAHATCAAGELCRHCSSTLVPARQLAMWRHGAASAAHPAVGVPDGDRSDVGHCLQLPLPCEGLVVHCQLQGDRGRGSRGRQRWAAAGWREHSGGAFACACLMRRPRGNGF
jgi:hypothetical protein